MFVLGVLVGLIGLIIMGQGHVDPDPNSPVWLTGRFQTFGPGILGLVFLLASFAALHTRRRAGLLFFAGTPVMAFILSYPGAGFLVWKPDGSGFYELPFLSTAVGLTCLFYAPLIAPLFAIRRRRLAVLLFLIPATIAIFVFAGSRWTSALLPRLGGWSMFFAAFGAFWLRTDMLDWPPLFNTRPTFRVKIAATLAACLLIAALGVTSTFALAVWTSSLNAGDCREKPLFARPVDPNQAVFIVRVIHSGHTAQVSGKWVGDWGIGLVQERFWAPAGWWLPRIVVLTNNVFQEGQSYFIDGRPSYLLLPHFLNIVEANLCTRTRPVENAVIDLRLLREANAPPLANQTRIIGTVQSRKRPSEIKTRPAKMLDMSAVLEWAIHPTAKYTPVAGARIRVTGSAGAMIVTTDAKGIYEVSDLVPEDYTLSLLDQPANQFAEDRKLQKKDLMQGRPLQLNFTLEWEGSIEGVVRDTSGNPAQVALELQNSDGTPVNDDFPRLITPSKNGLFRFKYLPPGTSYILMVNPWGPYKESPYAKVFYPSAAHPDAARVLKIEPQNQHLQNVDLAVRSLPERTLQVHASSPQGKPIEGASIKVAYENTKYWDDEALSSQVGETDRTGLAEVRLFGDFRVRVFADQSIEDLKTPPWYSHRYSKLVELETSKLPQRLDLIISSSQVALAP